MTINELHTDDETRVIKAPLSSRVLSSIAFVVVPAMLISLEGCKRSSSGVPVHGHVSYKGQPIERAALTFFPASGRPVSVAISEGNYSTELIPGEYVAVVNIGTELPKGYKEGDPVPPPSVVLPEEYALRAKSTLKATVNGAQREPIDFDLK